MVDLKVFFITSRGIRQGDPILLFFFIILAEVLGRSISRKRALESWKGILIANGIEVSTHSQFTNDTCLFGEALMAEAKVMKQVLDDYNMALG